MRKQRNNLPRLKKFRRRLRRNATKYEEVVWACIPYILDFYCPLEKLAIEIDGLMHEEEVQKQYDNRRTKYLEGCGIKVIRFSNGDTINNMDEILNKIKKALQY